jgi:hypothetical protein
MVIVHLIVSGGQVQRKRILSDCSPQNDGPHVRAPSESLVLVMALKEPPPTRSIMAPSDKAGTVEV